jgi:hypothetical protein
MLRAERKRQRRKRKEKTSISEDEEGREERTRDETASESMVALGVEEETDARRTLPWATWAITQQATGRGQRIGEYINQ